MHPANSSVLSSVLLQKITHLLIGAYDFRELARRAVELVRKELKGQGIATAAIGRLHEKDNLIYAYAYSTKYQKLIDRLLPARFSEFNIALSRTDNLAVQTVLTGQMQQSKRVADFSRGMIEDALADKIQKTMGGKLAMSLPIRLRSGKIAGVLLLLLSQERFTPEQVALFETVASQLGLAFSNVFAFEKLMQRYQRSQQLAETDISEEDLPSVKFTLRISPRENKNLERLARERAKTKAEVMRELLDRLFNPRA